MVARHLARMHARGRGLARGREVDGDDAQAALFQALADVEELAALGVEGAGDVGRAGAARGDRELEDPRPDASGRPRRRGRLRRRALGAAAASSGAAGPRAMSATGAGGAAGVPAREAAHAAGRRIARAPKAPSAWARRTVSTCSGSPGSAPARTALLVGLVVGGARAHAEQPFLQVAVAGQLGRRHLAGDAAVDHHADAVGDVDRDAEVLLDQQHRDLALGGQLRARPRPPARRSPAPGPRSARPSPAGAARAAARGRSRASAARRRKAARRRCPCARPGAGTSRRCGRPRACAGATRRSVSSTAERGPDAPALRHVGDAAPRDLVAAAGRGSPRRRGARCRSPRTSPVIALHSVVLPMPLRPTMAVHAALEREADALQRMGAAVVDVEALDDEQRALSRRASRSRREPGHQCLPPM